MKIRTSLGEYGRAAVASLVIMSAADSAFGQQEKEIDVWMAAPSDLTLAVTQVPPILTVTQVAPTDSALTSTEQGRTPLDESFEFRQRRGHYCRSQGLRHAFYQPQRHPHDAKYV